MAKVIAFGHGASCDFVFEPCIVEDAIPNYSIGYFCNSINRKTHYSCDPSHTVIALCDLYDLSGENLVPVPSMYKYFDNPAYRPKFELADFCPMYIDTLFSCQTPRSNIFKDEVFAEEKFGEKSRCVHSNHDRPLCLEVTCDLEENAVLVHLGSRKVKCRWKEKIHINDDIYFECPRKATLCPNSICPANCSGRGVCQWNSTIPSCRCFDGNVTSKNCNDYSVVLNPNNLTAEVDDGNHNSNISCTISTFEAVLLLPITFIIFTIIMN